MATVETRENAIALAERDGGWLCHYCGVPVGFIEDIGTLVTWNDGHTSWAIDSDSPIKVFAVDHKIPKAKGGADDLSNLLLTCTKCNQRKGKKDYDDFVRWLKSTKCTFV